MVCVETTTRRWVKLLPDWRNYLKDRQSINQCLNFWKLCNIFHLVWVAILCTCHVVWYQQQAFVYLKIHFSRSESKQKAWKFDLQTGKIFIFSRMWSPAWQTIRWLHARCRFGRSLRTRVEMSDFWSGTLIRVNMLPGFWMKFDRSGSSWSPSIDKLRSRFF